MQPNAQSLNDLGTSKPSAANTNTPSNAQYDEFFDSAPILMGHFESVDDRVKSASEMQESPKLR